MIILDDAWYVGCVYIYLYTADGVVLYVNGSRCCGVSGQ